MNPRPKYFGYMVVDHRNSPGIPGMPKFVEYDTQHCSHCYTPVILNPLRMRDRFICPGCDWFCCDQCAIGFKINGICKPYDKVADEVQSGKRLIPVLAKDIKE